MYNLTTIIANHQKDLTKHSKLKLEFPKNYFIILILEKSLSSVAQKPYISFNIIFKIEFYAATIA